MLLQLAKAGACGLHHWQVLGFILTSSTKESIIRCFPRGSVKTRTQLHFEPLVPACSEVARNTSDPPEPLCRQLTPKQSGVMLQQRTQVA